MLFLPLREKDAQFLQAIGKGVFRLRADPTWIPIFLIFGVLMYVAFGVMIVLPISGLIWAREGYDAWVAFGNNLILNGFMILFAIMAALAIVGDPDRFWRAGTEAKMKKLDSHPSKDG